jgi:N utilization substance protein B
VAARSKARKRAVDIVFEADLRGADLGATLAAWQRRADPVVGEHTARLAALVDEHRSLIDAALADRLVDWTLPRVAPVDRAILRVAVAELLWVDDVPDAVVIDEAVELAKSLSADESAAFVNAVLARVTADKPALLVAASSAGGDRPPGGGVEDSPLDEPVGELSGSLVVDHGE